MQAHAISNLKDARPYFVLALGQYIRNTANIEKKKEGEFATTIDFRKLRYFMQTHCQHGYKPHECPFRKSDKKCKLEYPTIADDDGRLLGMWFENLAEIGFLRVFEYQCENCGSIYEKKFDICPKCSGLLSPHKRTNGGILYIVNKGADTGFSDIRLLDLDMIDPPQHVIRDPGDVSPLIASISQHGLIYPILVRPKGERYEVIDGLRRYYACRGIGTIKSIPAIVRNMDEKKAFITSVLGNKERKEMDLIELAEALNYYLNEKKFGSIADASRDFSISEEHVRYVCKLVNLNDRTKVLAQVGWCLKCRSGPTEMCTKSHPQQVRDKISAEVRDLLADFRLSGRKEEEENRLVDMYLANEVPGTKLSRVLEKALEEDLGIDDAWKKIQEEDAYESRLQEEGYITLARKNANELICPRCKLQIKSLGGFWRVHSQALEHAN